MFTERLQDFMIENNLKLHENTKTTARKYSFPIYNVNLYSSTEYIVLLLAILFAIPA